MLHLFMSFTFTAAKANQQQPTQQIGCDVKMCLFPPAEPTHADCDSYIHPHAHARFSSVLRPISSSSMPTQTLAIPNLDRVFLPAHSLGLLSVSTVHIKPLSSTVMAAGLEKNARPADYERVKLAECISVTPITVTFYPH